MGLFNWVTKSLESRRGSAPGSRDADGPCFEQLEPRVLLSADALMPVESPFHDTPVEAAIYVDLETDQALSSQPSALSSQPSALSEVEGGVEGKKVGSEEGETVGQSDSGTVEQSDGLTVGQSDDQEGTLSNSYTGTPSHGLSVSELTTAASLSATTQNENSPSQADASEGLEPTTNNQQPITDATLGSINPRGPPTNNQEPITKNQQSFPQEVLFIDSSLNHDFQLNNAYQQGVLVSVFPGDSSGIQFISDFLSQYSNLSAIHIVSHGAPGQVMLGTEILDASTLERQSDLITAWSDSLVPGGDILLYNPISCQSR